MSIISSEIEAQKQRDPSYIDSDLQWAWGRGYKAGASREITEEEYERIDNIEDVREGDEVFTLSGKQVPGSLRLRIEGSVCRRGWVQPHHPT